MSDSNDINKNCSCPADCDNHGNCRLCRDNHAANGGRPFCDGSDTQPFEGG